MITQSINSATPSVIDHMFHVNNHCFTGLSSLEAGGWNQSLRFST